MVTKYEKLKEKVNRNIQEYTEELAKHDFEKVHFLDDTTIDYYSGNKSKLHRARMRLSESLIELEKLVSRL